MKIERMSPLVALAMVMAACGGSETGAWGGTVSDSAGIQIVMNPEAGIWGEGDAPAVKDELTIGRADGDPDYQFGQISGVDVGSDGTIYVLDQQASTIRAYNAQGVYQRTMGSKGSGPGELGPMVFGLVVTPGDTLLVPDLGQQRVTRFTSDGGVVGSFPTPMSQGLSVRWQPRDDGNVVQQSRIMNFPGQTTKVEPKDLLLLRNASGELLDTVMEMPAGQTLQMTANSMTIRFFEAEPVWGMTPDGTVYFGMNSNYSIESHDADGGLQKIIRRPVTRKPVTDGDKQAFLDAMRELFGRQNVPPPVMDQILSNVQFAEFYPAFATLMGGPGNSLWVQRVRTAADLGEGVDFNLQDSGSPEWDVFGTDGRYLGVIRTPDKFAPLRVIGDRIYGVWRDDLDVQYVKVLSVDLGDRAVPTERGS
jgi:hypothetical protein